MKKAKIIAVLACLAIGVGQGFAQSQTMTPYSRLGYGILSDNATSAQHAMGGVGYAMNSGRQINVMNPASYAAIDSLTFLFDMGVELDFLWSKENGASEDNIGGGLDYVTMAFPISKRMGASFGILPFASTNYSFSNEITNGSVSRAGSGDFSQLYIGAGYNPFKGAYLGFNFAYLFGSTTNDMYANIDNSSASVYARYLEVRDWRLDLGVQYTLEIAPEKRLTAGFSYSPGKSLHGKTYGLYYDVSQSTATADTVGYSKLNGLYSLPASYGVGLNYSYRNKLVTEIDFTYQPWKDAKYANIENFEVNEFANRWKIAAGVQFTPSPRGGYWGRTQYRAGAYYNHDYLMVRGNNVREYGLSVGVGLPVAVFKSIVSLSVEYMHRQAHPTPLVKEQYLNIRLGINFNEMWFRKSKIY